MAEVLNTDERQKRFEEYFEPMEITKKQKQTRVECAEKLYNNVKLFFTLYETLQAFDKLNNLTTENQNYLDNQFREEWQSTMEEYFPKLEDRQLLYLDIISAYIVGNTLKSGDISDERALSIAENESNSVINDSELSQAINDGYTRKEWVSMRDKKVRKTHEEVDGTIIPINDTFFVGDSLMLYPHDETYGAAADEIVNCRCSVRYLK